MELCLEWIRYGGVRNRMVKIVVYFLVMGMLITLILAEVLPEFPEKLYGKDCLMPGISARNDSLVPGTDVGLCDDISVGPGIIGVMLPEVTILGAATTGIAGLMTVEPEKAGMEPWEMTENGKAVSGSVLSVDALLMPAVSGVVPSSDRKENGLDKITSDPKADDTDVTYRDKEDMVIPDITKPEPDAAAPAVPDVIRPDDDGMDDTGMEDVGSENAGVEETPGAVVAAGGFMIDEAGMIYGFVPELADLTDGILVLPSEGCNGIRRGAFDGKGAGIVEIYIPVNISVIEDGALAGLDELEWIETTGNSNYVSLEGVLFDSSLSVLIAFPNGRTGAYIVPASVTRFADGAFSNTSLSMLDMRSCGNVDIGNKNLEALSVRGIEILGPQSQEGMR